MMYAHTNYATYLPSYYVALSMVGGEIKIYYYYYYYYLQHPILDCSISQMELMVRKMNINQLGN